MSEPTTTRPHNFVTNERVLCVPPAGQGHAVAGHVYNPDARAPADQIRVHGDDGVVYTVPASWCRRFNADLALAAWLKGPRDNVVPYPRAKLSRDLVRLALLIDPDAARAAMAEPPDPERLVPPTGA
jgi:hypothetical protein